MHRLCCLRCLRCLRRRRLRLRRRRRRCLRCLRCLRFYVAMVYAMRPPCARHAPAMRPPCAHGKSEPPSAFGNGFEVLTKHSPPYIYLYIYIYMHY